MANIQFFEKPGCINGDKQKAILERAGHQLECINILTHDWTREELEPFLCGRTAAEIMNHTAPAIKNGQLKPAQLSYDEAIELMVNDPILIKRPLIQIGDMKLQGFTHPKLAGFLGDWDGQENVTTCPRLQSLSCDQLAEK